MTSTLVICGLVVPWFLLVFKDAPASWYVPPREVAAKAKPGTYEQQRIAFLEEELERLRSDRGYGRE